MIDCPFCYKHLDITPSGTQHGSPIRKTNGELEALWHGNHGPVCVTCFQRIEDLKNDTIENEEVNSDSSITDSLWWIL